MNKEEVFAHPNFPKYLKTNPEDWEFFDSHVGRGPELRYHPGKMTVSRATFSTENNKLTLLKTELIETDNPHFYIYLRFDDAGNLQMGGFNPTLSTFTKK